MSKFPIRLKIALDRKGMRQSVLAYRCGVDQSTISNYLKGRYEPKNDMLMKLCTVLDVDPAWLSGYDIDPDLTAPEAVVLTPGEARVLELLRSIPEAKREIFIQMFEGALEKLK